jgi:hypothetical protein
LRFVVLHSLQAVVDLVRHRGVSVKAELKGPRFDLDALVHLSPSGRSLLVIIWHLLADPDTRFHDLGADHYDHHVSGGLPGSHGIPPFRRTRTSRGLARVADKVFEIVRDSVRPNKLDRSGLASARELKAFTASANRPDVSGADARHARSSGEAPSHHMLLSRGTPIHQRSGTGMD